MELSHDRGTFKVLGFFPTNPNPNERMRHEIPKYVKIDCYYPNNMCQCGVYNPE